MIKRATKLYYLIKRTRSHQGQIHYHEEYDLLVHLLLDLVSEMELMEMERPERMLETGFELVLEKAVSLAGSVVAAGC